MIHKTAVIDSKTKLDKNVQVGPYCVIGPNVEIGENTMIQSHVNISGNTKIGKENNIYPSSVLQLPKGFYGNLAGLQPILVSFEKQKPFNLVCFVEINLIDSSEELLSYILITHFLCLCFD